METGTPIWLITGASSGFGEAIAAEALRRGHKVVAAARKTSSMTSLGEAGASLLALDVTSDDATVAAAAKEANAFYGGITHLVTSAGYMLEGFVEEASTQEVYDLFNCNVFGTLKVIRAVLPYMRETSSAGPRVIATLGSSGSWTSWASCGIYCSTKWAISGFTEGLATELAPQGIKAVVIEPGVFDTNILAQTGSRQQHAEAHLPVYKEFRETVNNGMIAFDNAGVAGKGNVVKAGRAIVDVLTKTGTAEGRDIPVRLLLGPDAVATVETKLKDTVKLMEEWSDVISSTVQDP